LAGLAKPDDAARIAEVSGDEGPCAWRSKARRRSFVASAFRQSLFCAPANRSAKILHQTTSVQYDLTIIGAERKGSTGLYLARGKTYEVIKAIPSPVLLATGACETLRASSFAPAGKISSTQQFS